MIKNKKYIYSICLFAFIAIFIFWFFEQIKRNEGTENIQIIRNGISGYKTTKNDFSTNFKDNPTETNAVVFSKNESKISFYTYQKQDFGEIESGKIEHENNSLIYKNIHKDTDLKYTVTKSRLLEEFIIKDSQTALNFKTIKQEAILENIEKFEISQSGKVTFYYKGIPVFYLPEPVIYEYENLSQKSYGIKYEIKEMGKNKLLVEKVINKDGLVWLTDPTRQYPVAIDLVIDNADTSSNWVSSDSNLLTVAQETTIKQEGTGSVKMYPTNWYNASWPYRTKLTIEADYVDADLTDFPVYVDLNDLPAAFHSHVNQTDARDIRVTKGDGSTELPREVVFYTAASDTGELHFKYTGTLSGSTDTSVYIYYGNSGASDYAIDATYGAENVWDDNYVLVQHFNETSGTHYDSTQYDNDSTAISVTTQGSATGKIGGADDLNGTTDYIKIDDSDSLDLTTALTFSVWAYVDAYDVSYPRILSKEPSTDANPYNLMLENSRQVFLGLNWGSSGVYAHSTGTISSSAWQYVAVNWTSGDNDFFLNGSYSAPDTNLTGTITTNTNHLYIGNNSSTNRNFDGKLDEIRISKSVRASTWISTEYDNQNTPGTFFNSFGSEEGIAGQTATRTVSATDLSAYDSLTFWVRSDRTGSFMRFQMGESTSSEQTNAITINSADTWEQKTWDISGISPSARDAVTKYAFYVTDASADFDFYFDDIQANSPTPTPTATPTVTPTATPTSTPTATPISGSYNTTVKGVNLKGIDLE